MTYAVIDTNVLVSASITKNPLSPTVKVIANMLDGRIKPVYNRDIIAEYTDVLHRPKFHLNENDIKLLILSKSTASIPTVFLSMEICPTRKTAHSMKFH